MRTKDEVMENLKMLHSGATSPAMPEGFSKSVIFAVMQHHLWYMEIGDDVIFNMQPDALFDYVGKLIIEWDKKVSIHSIPFIFDIPEIDQKAESTNVDTEKVSDELSAIDDDPLPEKSATTSDDVRSSPYTRLKTQLEEISRAERDQAELLKRIIGPSTDYMPCPRCGQRTEHGDCCDPKEPTRGAD